MTYRAGTMTLSQNGVSTTTILAGGAAGNHTVAGIATVDQLASVEQCERVSIVGVGLVVQTVNDLTDEFTITSGNTINNTGGTDTTNDILRVIWMDRHS